MKTQTVYVTQYDGWWKLTADQWRSLCESAAVSGCYELPNSAALKRRPGKVVGATDYGSGRPSYYALRDGIRIAQPLDWDAEAFANELREMAEADER